jgi:hypothetical protein
LEVFNMMEKKDLYRFDIPKHDWNDTPIEPIIRAILHSAPACKEQEDGRDYIVGKILCYSEDGKSYVVGTNGRALYHSPQEVLPDGKYAVRKLSRTELELEKLPDEEASHYPNFKAVFPDPEQYIEVGTWNGSNLVELLKRSKLPLKEERVLLDSVTELFVLYSMIDGCIDPRLLEPVQSYSAILVHREKLGEKGIWFRGRNGSFSLIMPMKFDDDDKERVQEAREKLSQAQAQVE